MISRNTVLKLTCLTLVTLIVSAANAATVSIQDLGWLSGYWTGTYQGQNMEAHYSNPDGNMILGMTKILNAQGGVEFFEFEQLEQTNSDLILRPMPFGKVGAEFPVKELKKCRVVFENPSHDFPTRIIYELKSSGQLLARIEGRQNGQDVSEEFLFTKAE